MPKLAPPPAYLDRMAAQLRSASAQLSRVDIGPRWRLRAAAHAFWTTLGASSAWPPDMQVLADALAARLLAAGGIDETIDGMDDAELRSASEDLRRLCGQFERRRKQRATP